MNRRPRKMRVGLLSRSILRLYPRSFRCEFGDDLKRDAALEESRSRLGRPAVAINLLKNLLLVRLDDWKFRRRRSTAVPSFPREPLVETLIYDFRFAIRSLSRNPLLTGAAVLTLALGVGANSTIFSLVNGIILQPLPYPQSEELVRVWPERTFNHRILEMFRERTRSFQGLSAYSGWTMTLTGEGVPERLSGAQVSTNHFDVIGVAPSVGRGFRPEESLPGRSDVAILSHGFWQRRFGGDSSVLGRRVDLSLENRDSFTIIGVMPAGYRSMRGPEAWQAWVPLERPEDLETDRSWFLSVVGRLGPGITKAEASDEVAELAREVRRTFYPRFSEEEVESASVHSLLSVVVGETTRTRLTLLMAAVALILIISSANVGNLLLARTTARRHELEIRTSLGATPSRIRRLIVCEGLAIGIVGGMAGLTLSSGLLSFWIPRLSASLPRAGEVTLDGSVFVFALAVSLLSGLSLGLMPALRSGRGHSLVMHGRTTTTSAGRSRVSSALVAAEIALSVVLVLSAGLLLKSFVRLSQVDPGFDSERIVTFSISTPDKWETSRKRQFFKESLKRIRALPFVEAAGSNHILPLSPGNWSFTYFTKDHPLGPSDSPPSANFRVVTPGYFETLGIGLQQGRLFEPTDLFDQRQVGIINESLASRLWPEENPLGKEVHIFNDDGPAFRVVGVVSDILHHGLDGPHRPAIYRPYEQWTLGSSFFAVRVPQGQDELEVIEPVRSIVQSLSSEVPIGNVSRMRDIVGGSLSGSRLVTSLLTSFAGLALLLALVGVYGVTSFSESRRRNEFGIRMALGADSMRVVGESLRRALRPIVIGQVIGLVAAAAGARFLSGLLFEVDAADPTTYVAVVGLTSLCAVVACLLPASRAGKVDPAAALRSD